MRLFTKTLLCSCFGSTSGHLASFNFRTALQVTCWLCFPLIPSFQCSSSAVQVDSPHPFDAPRQWVQWLGSRSPQGSLPRWRAQQRAPVQREPLKVKPGHLRLSPKVRRMLLGLVGASAPPCCEGPHGEYSSPQPTLPLIFTVSKPAGH